MRNVIYICLFGIFLIACNSSDRSGTALLSLENYSKEGRLNASLLVLNDAIIEDSENAELYFKRAQIFQELFAWEAALKDIELSLNHNPEVSQYLLIKSQLLYELGNNSEALATVENIAESQLDNPFYYTHLAELYIDLDSLDLANDYLREALLIAPGLLPALQVKGKLQTKQNEVDLAVLTLRKALNLDLGNEKSYDLLAKAFLKKSKLDSAIFYMEMGFQNTVDSTYLGLWYTKGKIMERLGKSDSALRIYEKMLVIAPERANVYSDIGEIQIKRAYFLSGFSAYENAIKQVPEEKSNYIRALFCLENLRRYEDARELYLKAKNKFPEEARFTLGLERMTTLIERQFRSVEI